MDLFLLLATCLTNLILGLVIFSRDSSKSYARFFLLMSVVISLWVSTNYLTNHYLGSMALVDVANRLAYFFGYGVVVSGLLFTYFFPLRRQPRPAEVWSLAVLIVFTLAFSVTEAIAGRVALSGQTVTFVEGSATLFYLASFVLLVFIIAKNLLILPKDMPVKVRQQARIVLFAFVASALFGLTLNLILPLSGDGWQLTRFGPLATVLLVGLTAYAMIRHGLFDIKLAAIRAVGYVLTLATLAIGYFAMAYFISVTILHDTTTSFGTSAVNMALALVLAFLFQPLKRIFDALTDKVFFRDTYTPQEILDEVSIIVASEVTPNHLMIAVSRCLKQHMKIDRATVYLRDTDRFYGLKSEAPHHLTVALVDKHLNRTGKLSVATDDLTSVDQELYEELSGAGIGFIVRLQTAKRVVGYLCLGYKRNGDSYSSRDKKVLLVAASELSVALQNSLRLDEIRRFNETLRSRIEEATHELKRSNKRLHELDKTKDEFISMASHQLRTPLTTIKGYISMVLEGDVGRVSAMQRKLLEEAFDSSQRMSYLITDFLNVSRLQTGKFELEQKPTNLSEVLGQEISQLESIAKSRQIKINYRAHDVPTLTLDENKMRQVMMNFIDNAIYYSPAGSEVTVSLKESDGEIIFKVVDQGIGVPEKEKEGLFTKFYRASNARKQRPDGTGIGLFMAKKVIVAHGGETIFKSKVGKGSTFGFRLPLDKMTKKSVESTQ